MMMQATKTLVTVMTLVFTLFIGQTAVVQAADVTFDKVDTEVRGGINFGTLAQCMEKVYTPVSDTEGKLRVIHSSFVGDNLAPLPQQNNDHVAGAITEVDVARLNGCNFFVTVTRDSSNMVKLVSWFSGADGVDRLGDSGNNGAAASEVAAVGAAFPFGNEVDRGYVVTAVRGASGHLVMTSWDVNGGNFQLESTIIDEQASQIAMTTMPPRPEEADAYVARIVTAFKNSAGNLKLVFWKLDAYGALHRIADSGNQAGNVQQVAIAQYHTNHVMTAVKNSDGNLQMVPWVIGEESIQRQNGDGPEFSEPLAGPVQEIDITAINIAHPLFKHVVTAVGTADGHLRLIAWGIDTVGNLIRRGASENVAAPATKINIEWSQNASRIITSVRDSEGNLRIAAWRVLN